MYRGAKIMAGYEAAIHAALHGPEDKGISVHGHDFNVKKMTIGWSSTHAIASGQISHRLAGRPDDQVYYTITVNSDDFSISNIDVKVDENPLADFIVMNHLAGSFVVGIFVPVAGSALAAAEPIVKEIARRAESAVVGNWEEACRALISAIAAALSVAMAAREIKRPSVHGGFSGGHHHQGGGKILTK
jgi:hypothetical protein